MIQHIVLEGSDIQRVIHDRLAPALEDESLQLSIISLLSYAVWLAKPDIDVEELRDIVHRLSESMAMQIAPTGMMN